MALRTLDQLPLVLQRYRKGVATTTNRIVREAARQGAGYLASDTAVDTGEARSNWIASIDQPFTGTIPPYNPRPKLGNAAASRYRKAETANLGAAQKQHALATAAFDVERNSAVYITNNVGHIELIEQGHSPQTLPGLLARGLERARNAIVGMWKVAPIGP